jgi:hypothetical protein
MRITTKSIFIALVAIGAACSKDPPTGGAAASASVSASAPVTSASVGVSPSASAAVVEPPHDCPTGSAGIGSFAKPCEAKGTARMLELVWNGKSDENGSPTFKVTSKSAKPILWGRVAIYFYDKAGKQIDAKEPIEGSDKTHMYHPCSGKLFAGIINPAEKASYNFSCVKKSNIPDGVAAIEAEAETVSFADATGKKSDFYWKNPDLAPEARAKGGVKPAAP